MDGWDHPGDAARRLSLLAWSTEREQGQYNNRRKQLGHLSDIAKAYSLFYKIIYILLETNKLNHPKSNKYFLTKLETWLQW